MLRNLLFKALGVLILVLSLGGGWFLIGYTQFLETPLRVPAGTQPTTIAIAPGASIKIVARELYEAGVLEHPFYFVCLARLQGSAGRIRAGEYELEPGILPRQFLDKLVSGKIKLHALTIVEGWAFSQLLEAMRREEKLNHTLAGLSDIRIMARLGLAGLHPEGQFLPDTYLFPAGMSDVDFLRRAHDALEQYLNQAWTGRAPNLPYRNVYDALVLASIVEKETGVASEREQVAGVFIRRMRIGMRLQSDPTVIYGMRSLFDGNLRRQDLLTPTPYNTYTEMGLPPTPIALPGKAAIHAALHPATGDALYFVGRGDGTHHFSATLEEHNAAVRRYQLHLPASAARY